MSIFRAFVVERCNKQINKRNIKVNGYLPRLKFLLILNVKTSVTIIIVVIVFSVAIKVKTMSFRHCNSCHSIMYIYLRNSFFLGLSSNNCDNVTRIKQCFP